MSPDDSQVLAPIMALHRHEDGYISFAVARDDGEDFRPLVSIRRDVLAQYFPEFRAQLLKDAYVSINADWRVRKYGPDGAAYGIPLHRTDRLRYLCAAYTDIDFYKLGLTYGQAIGTITDMQTDGRLPARASIIVKSGRGLWLLYLLHDQKDPSRAPGAFPEKKELYYRLQRAIGERVAAIGSDPCARDAARYTRLPGSLHTGCEQSVEWSIWGEGPRAYSYSLPQLCQLFDVKPPLRNVKERAAIASETSKLKRRGWVALNERRLREFNLLRERRGGFSKGLRNNAAMIYSWLLRCNGVVRSEAALAVTFFGTECHPPLMRHESQNALKSTFAGRSFQMRDQTIADRLDITVEEVVELELRLPPATRFRQPEGPPAPMAWELRGKSIMERRELIITIIGQLGGKVPPVRDMGRRLIEAGYRGNHQTVQKDYRALGIESGRTLAARAEIQQKTAERQPDLFESGI